VRWTKQHPDLNLQLWISGLDWFDPVTDQRIYVETDPLEVLQMGNSVGSCLAMGGWFSHSAAAVVLDLNKSVLFARNSRGEFLGRQRIAIDDEGRLVCSPVYPLSASPSLKWAFRDYDQRFAQALGVELGKGDVSLLIANDCYEDYPWDFVI
jgi:hypothetical protein